MGASPIGDVVVNGDRNPRKYCSGTHRMAENAHYQQLGKFVDLVQGLESSLIEIISAITGEDYAVETLPVETKYRRLVGSTDIIFSHFVDLLRQPDLEAKTRFHKLIERCLDIGVLRDRLNHSKYALLRSAGDIVAPVNEKAKLKFKGDSPRQVLGEDLPFESFEPYFQEIADVRAELESFRRKVIEWKYPDGRAITTARKS